MIDEVALSPEDYDVCAFTLRDFGWDAPDAELKPPALYPGGPVRFLGFPHGLENTYPSSIGFATPLVRHAHLSGAIEAEGKNLMILDGFNNPGYSGGPIYAGLEDGTPSLVGIVTGYRVELREKSLVYRDQGDGHETPLLDMYVKPNSGMIHALALPPLKTVFDLIDGNNATIVTDPE